MANVTFGHPSDARIWQGLIAGDLVRVKRRGRLVRCSKCDGLRLDYAGPHSLQAHAGGRFTDCTGAEVSRG